MVVGGGREGEKGRGSQRNWKTEERGKSEMEVARGERGRVSC